MTCILSRLEPGHPPFRFKVVAGSADVLIGWCILKFRLGDKQMGIPGQGSIFFNYGYTNTLCDSDSLGRVAFTWIIHSKTIGGCILKSSVPFQMGGVSYLITLRAGEEGPRWK